MLNRNSEPTIIWLESLTLIHSLFTYKLNGRYNAVMRIAHTYTTLIEYWIRYKRRVVKKFLPKWANMKNTLTKHHQVFYTNCQDLWQNTPEIGYLMFIVIVATFHTVVSELWIDSNNGIVLNYWCPYIIGKTNIQVIWSISTKLIEFRLFSMKKNYIQWLENNFGVLRKYAIISSGFSCI